MDDTFVTIGIASIRERTHNLKVAIYSLIDQCDKINVFLNGYKGLYSWMNHTKISLFDSRQLGDYGDAGKFYDVENNKGYYFSCDDDLIYPEDYVVNTIEGIERHKRKAIVSYHGRTFNDNIRSYYMDSANVFHCLNKVGNDKPVHFGGTGVMAFHKDTLQIDRNTLPLTHKNMADIHIGLFAQKNKIPLRVLAHEKDWIKAQKNIRNTIYSKHRLDDRLQTELVNSIKLQIYD